MLYFLFQTHILHSCLVTFMNAPFLLSFLKRILMNAAVIRCETSLKIRSHRFQVICMLFEDFSPCSCTEICNTPTPGKVTILLNFFKEKTVFGLQAFFYKKTQIFFDVAILYLNSFLYGMAGQQHQNTRLQLLFFQKTSVVLFASIILQHASVQNHSFPPYIF